MGIFDAMSHTKESKAPNAFSTPGLSLDSESVNTNKQALLPFWDTSPNITKRPEPTCESNRLCTTAHRLASLP